MPRKGFVPRREVTTDSVFGSDFFFQAEDGIRDKLVTGVQTCALPISAPGAPAVERRRASDPLARGDRGRPRRRSARGAGSICVAARIPGSPPPPHPTRGYPQSARGGRRFRHALALGRTSLGALGGDAGGQSDRRVAGLGDSGGGDGWRRGIARDPGGGSESQSSVGAFAVRLWSADSPG